MKKSYILFASAALLFAGCANDEFTGDKGLSSDNAPIAFNMQTGAQTRADAKLEGKTAAEKLGKEFIVWGEKNEAGGAKATDGNLVFENYVVKYTSTNETPTENTTLSNTKGWEYVGYTPYKSDYVSPSIGETTKQTIKYWDMNASSYTFTAVSAKSDDISGGTEGTAKVKIEKIEGGDGVSAATDKGYTITVKSGASTGNIYVADRVVVSKPDGGTTTINRTEPNKYGGLVQFTFRNFETKIRFGIYETVPGYKVVITGIKYNTADSSSPTEHKSDSEDKTFGVDGNFIVAGNDSKTTTYTVTYEGASSTNPNKAVMTVNADPNKQAYMTTGGTNWLSTSWTSKTENSCIGSSAIDATYDKTVDSDKKAYTAILPNKDNAANLKLTVKYDLYSEDTGEKIEVGYKTVEVPSAYCQWKNNYAYTYLFKITDSSAELYPITFDAVVETDENGNQETITTVTEPSITTFGYDATNSKVITGKDEYTSGTDIYASVVVNGTVASDLSTNAALYTVTTENATDFPITEASVANAIAQADVSGKVKATKVTSGVTYETTVPAEDGSERDLKAMKWKGTIAEGATVTYYAVEYTKDGKKTYKIVKVVKETTD